MSPGLKRWHALHLAPMASPAIQALRRNGRVLTIGAVAALALLGAFGQVVQGAVLRADAVRAATRVQSDSLWRCESLNSAPQRNGCRGTAARELTTARSGAAD